MKKILFMGVLFMVLTPIALFAAQQGSPSIAFVNDFKGGCKIKQGAGADWADVYQNMPIYESDELKTNPGSFVEIVFDDATIIRLDQSSTLKVAQLQRDEGQGASCVQQA